MTWWIWTLIGIGGVGVFAWILHMIGWLCVIFEFLECLAEGVSDLCGIRDDDFNGDD